MLERSGIGPFIYWTADNQRIGRFNRLNRESSHLREVLASERLEAASAE
jgi:hypothetical protein